MASLLVLLAAAPARADGDCKATDGPFTSSLVPPPTCTSPVGLCTHGILHDDLDATYDFTFQTLVPAGDPAHPSRMFYTGQSVITMNKSGAKMFSNDHGYIDFNPAGLSPFVTTVMLYAGDKGASSNGVIVAQGMLNLSTGNAVGSYTGALCR
jgi:hypothetical protein